MDSSFPPSRPAKVSSHLRPWYVLVAMIATGFIGFSGACNGYGLARVVREGAIPNIAGTLKDLPEATDPMGVLTTLAVVFANTRVAVFVQTMNRAFGWCIAEALLFGVLFIASSIALGGRKGARTFALQAIAATCAFSILEYVFTAPARAAQVDAVMRAASAVPRLPGTEAFFEPQFWWTLARISLVGPLVLLGLAAFALTRPRTKAFFEATARATERDDDE